MKNISVILFVILISFSCTNSSSNNKSTSLLRAIAADLNISTINPLLEMTSSIKLIPLETNDSIIIGSKNEMLIDGSEFLIVNNNANNKILRFDNKGKFINSIGKQGRGPGEYAKLTNASVNADTVVIYSGRGLQRLKYTKSGDFISQSSCEGNNGYWVYNDGDDYVVYNGYGMVDPERVYTYNAKDSVRVPFLTSSAKVLSIQDELPAFCEYDDKLYIREFYSDTIFCYDLKSKSISPYLKFDMGQKTISKSIFEYGDAMESAMALMEGEFANIRRFMKNESLSLVEIMINEKPLPAIVYGVSLASSPEKWHWFSPGKIDKGAFATTICAIYDNKIYALIEPYRLSNLTSGEKKLISNPEVLDKIGENDNLVVAVVELK